MTFQLCDTVELLEPYYSTDEYDDDVEAGEIGTIVDVINDGEAFRVEFIYEDSERLGMTKALLVLYPNQIRPYVSKGTSKQEWTRLEEMAEAFIAKLNSKQNNENHND
ncbi:MAG: DUF4926 domain-containing protein [Thermoguttaceae bacterium]|nr:DUF4926 domain-containing protein [Thermoguttaceae bacterium]